jgi:hypothetical protein
MDEIAPGVSRRFCLVASCFVLAVHPSRTRAETTHDDKGTEAVEPLRANRLVVQGGMLPTASFLGIEYTRAILPLLELSASASYGLTTNAAFVPRLRWSWSRSSFSVGGGPALSYDSSGYGDSKSWMIQLLADGELTYETIDHWVLQARLGLTTAREMDPVVYPFVGLGMGRTF